MGLRFIAESVVKNYASAPIKYVFIAHGNRSYDCHLKC